MESEWSLPFATAVAYVIVLVRAEAWSWGSVDGAFDLAVSREFGVLGLFLCVLDAIFQIALTAIFQQGNQ